MGKLIDTEVICWKSSVVDSIFMPHEAEAVKSIPLSVCSPQNKLVWVETANGKFTIKSAYNLAVRISSSSIRGNVSDCSLLRRFWRSL